MLVSIQGPSGSTSQAASVLFLLFLAYHHSTHNKGDKARVAPASISADQHPSRAQVGEGKFLWPSGRDAAVVFSWDDNNYASNERAVSLTKAFLKNTSVPMTFYANPGCDDFSESRVKALLELDDRNEIGVHTWSHEDMRQNNDTVTAATLTRSHQLLNAIVGRKHSVTTLSYPYGVIPQFDSHPATWTIIKSFFSCARSVHEGVNLRHSFDQYRLKVRDTNGDVDTALSTALNRSGLLVLFGHGIEGHGGYGATPEAHFNKTLQRMSKSQDRIWFATLSEAMSHLIKTQQISVPQMNASHFNDVISNLAQSVQVPLRQRLTVPSLFRGNCPRY